MTDRDDQASKADPAPPLPDARALRSAFGRFATGVAIVTAWRPDGRAEGMTINSFSSVSLDPPLVLWSLDHASRRRDLFGQAKSWTVSVLAAGQADLAMACARGPGLLDDVGDADPLGHPPAIAGAIAHFACESWATYPGGDHEILVGRVLDFATREGDALTFFSSRFGVLA